MDMQRLRPTKDKKYIFCMMLIKLHIFDFEFVFFVINQDINSLIEDNVNSK